MMVAAMHVVLANSIVHTIGGIFQPIFKLFASILAFIYAIIPNYAAAIAVLTIVIMGALTPLTVKSTKSMMAMQRLQPEIKKLQQKYKGPENRTILNEEMMRLYKEEGVSPAGGCLPMFIQMPFLFILYDIIRGLTNISKVKIPVPEACHLSITMSNVAPRYIPHTSKMYCDLISSGGKMEALGINLALKPFSKHGSIWEAIPFFVLVGIAVLLQYIQMSRMNRRNAAAQANSQMATLQKFMPIIFAYIYFLIPAAVLIYMIVSSVIRIGTQEAIFRSGIAGPPGGPPKGIGRSNGKAAEMTIEARSSEKPTPAKAAEPKTNGQAKGVAQNGAARNGSSRNGAAKSGAAQNGAAKPKPNPSARAKNKRKRKDR